MAARGTGAALRQLEAIYRGGSVAGMTDAQLLERFAKRDDEATAEAAFAAIVARHGPMVLGVCRKLVRDPIDAEDAFQATFLVLARRAGAVRVDDSAGRWLYGVARRVAARARRRSAGCREASGEVAPEVASAGPGPLDEAIGVERVEVVRDEVDRLPDRYREAVVLCHLEGRSLDEAAARLGRPVGTIKVRLSRARALLRDRLARRGLAPGVLPVAVPAALLHRTVQAAVRDAFRLGGGLAGAAVSGTALNLTEGVIAMTGWAKVQTAGVALLSLGVTVAAVGGLAMRAQEGPASDRVGIAGRIDQAGRPEPPQAGRASTKDPSSRPVEGQTVLVAVPDERGIIEPQVDNDGDGEPDADWRDFEYPTWPSDEAERALMAEEVGLLRRRLRLSRDRANELADQAVRLELSYEGVLRGLVDELKALRRNVRLFEQKRASLSQTNGRADPRESDDSYWSNPEGLDSTIDRLDRMLSAVRTSGLALHPDPVLPTRPPIDDGPEPKIPPRAPSGRARAEARSPFELDERPSQSEAPSPFDRPDTPSSPFDPFGGATTDPGRSESHQNPFAAETPRTGSNPLPVPSRSLPGDVPMRPTGDPSLPLIPQPEPPPPSPFAESAPEAEPEPRSTPSPAPATEPTPSPSPFDESAPEAEPRPEPVEWVSPAAPRAREADPDAPPEYVVEPPDMIRIEVLETLPGRPITGERLVRPDGRVSLDFYGNLYVEGLTPSEIKEKLILHLRQFLNDESLGLIELNPATVQHVMVHPKDSNRVYVDVTSYNSKAYYVQGDVAAPGRQHVTGGDTVLDAINYAGGLLPTADPGNIRLIRPAEPGTGTDAEVLPVDWEAIVERGDPSTNYALKPGDRIIVYRDPVTVDIEGRIEQAFLADENVQSLRQQLRDLDDQLKEAQRRIRNPGDPLLSRLQSQRQRLLERYEQLWADLEPALRAKLTGTIGGFPGFDPPIEGPPPIGGEQDNPTGELPFPENVNGSPMLHLPAQHDVLPAPEGHVVLPTPEAEAGPSLVLPSPGPVGSDRLPSGTVGLPADGPFIHPPATADDPFTPSPATVSQPADQPYLPAPVTSSQPAGVPIIPAPEVIPQPAESGPSEIATAFRALKESIDAMARRQEPGMFTVSGAVGTPGRFVVAGEMRISDALDLTGGIVEEQARPLVYLLRPGEPMREIPIGLEGTPKREEDDEPLRPGDQLVVPRVK